MSDSAPTPSNIKGLASKKLFGVPVLYIAALFVVILAVVAWKMKGSNSTPTDTTSTAAADGTDPTQTSGDVIGDTPTDSNGDLLPTLSGGTVVASNTDPVTTASTVATNDTWYKQAVEWLVQNGTADGDAEVALQTYLAGGSLTYAQGQLRDKATQHFGIPPTPPTVGGTGTKPAQKQGTPPIHHTVQGPNDNSASKLAQLYFGSASADYINLIQGENSFLGGADYAPGTVVYIPKYHAARYFTATSTVNTVAQIAAKNGISQAGVVLMNDSMHFPVKVGTKVRVA